MPNTIAENLQRLVDAKEDIADAITAKGGTVGANDGLENFASDIASIPSGGGSSSQPRKDVNFYDYDGTIVNSYSAVEFAELSAMPDNPTHEGLTAQGWNWSLSDAKEYVASYGKLEIGQMYITSDGKTRIYITLSEGRTSPVLRLYLNENSELDIEWGDGSAHSTFTATNAAYATERHDYAIAGDYVITITVIRGSFILQSSSTNLSSILWNEDDSANSPDVAYNNAIRKVRLGSSVELGTRAFYKCSSLSSITIPNGVTSFNTNAFTNCTALSSITIPNGVTTIGTQLFNSCTALLTITLPKSITDINEGAFYQCYSLTSIIIPSSATIGQNAFQNCYSLTSIIIPSSATIGQSAFYQCYSLAKVIISNGIGYIAKQAFSRCTSLTSIIIPNSVSGIGNYAFQNCYSLAKITINKAEGSISGSPWGAITSSPTNTQIIWTG